MSLHHRPYVRRRDRDANGLLVIIVLLAFIGMIATVIS